jgi:hypothetical protein
MVEKAALGQNLVPPVSTIPPKLHTHILPHYHLRYMIVTFENFAKLSISLDHALFLSPVPVELEENAWEAKTEDSYRIVYR